MTFIDTILDLINQKGISKNKLLTDLGLGKNSFVNWTERGTIPSGETISKIAEYFNVSTDYLLGKTESPTTTNDSEVKVSDKDIKFALFSGSEDITDEMFDEVKRFAQYIRSEKIQKEREKLNDKKV